MATVYTIGHSTRSLEDFVSILHAHRIRALVDIRFFPGSRRLPHFNREALEKSLAGESIQYLWLKDLGGRRKKQLDPSPNVALRSPSFRNYADYMLSQTFQEAAKHLIDLAQRTPAAIMCAELLFFRCHRMLVSDYLLLHGHQVLHIQDVKPPRPHQLTREVRLVKDEVLYVGDRLLY